MAWVTVGKGFDIVSSHHGMTLKLKKIRNVWEKRVVVSLRLNIIIIMFFL